MRIAVFIFFAVFLFIGIAVFKDYGISWDEPLQRELGKASVEYISGRRQDLMNMSPEDGYHGPAFQIALFSLERALGLYGIPRLTFLMRHLATFLIFYAGVIFFYLLCRRRFQSWKIGLTGALFLILSPRIFADSFYNPKDIPFLSLFIISVYTLTRYLEEKTPKWAFFHALACALLIDVRILGAMVPAMTLIFIGVDPAKSGRAAKSFFIYAVSLIFFITLFWPLLWASPVYYFTKIFTFMRHFPNEIPVLYLGKNILSADLPWHYLPVWIIITTPIFYTVCFFIGCAVSVFSGKREDAICALWVFLPLILVIMQRSNVYDAWRHVFFIYPGMLVFSLAGLLFLFRQVKKRFSGIKYRIACFAAIFAAAGSLSGAAGFMVRYHPYQNVYFNVLAGRNMEEVKKNFELDYWGVSYKQALEYILRNDADKNIRICVANQPGLSNSCILPSKDRCRLIYVNSPEEAEYFLTNYRLHREEYPFKEYYSIRVRGAKIMGVYKIMNS